VAPSALAALASSLDREIDEVHSLMVVRHGQVVAEGWWDPYGPDRPHLLYSLTKSFTSTAVGLAVGEGLLSLDDPVVKFFPGVAPARPSRHLAALTVRHLLTMSTGRLTDSLMDCVTDRTGDWVRGFFAQPWLQAPGDPFVYDSGASHVLGALVTAVTGQDLRAYLMPRLFEPLGIAEPRWETDPRGRRTGGFGLSLTTEDIAKFGLLCLQDGAWEGRQLLPTGWVAQATAKQVDTDRFAPGTHPEWLSGYGFQFWRNSVGGYRADGAHGQYCVVLPEHDLVVVLTEGTGDGGGALQRVWKHLLPGLSDRLQPEDPREVRGLTVLLGALGHRPPAGERHSDLETTLRGRKFVLEKNPFGFREVRVRFDAGGMGLEVAGKTKVHRLEAGRGAWREAPSDLLDRPEPRDPRETAPAAALVSAFAWTGPRSLTIVARMVETPYRFTLVLAFEDGRFRAEVSANVAMGVPPSYPRLVGVERRAAKDR
jgi:CubicO group peptidase (beta-lactamase class C family)